MRGHYYSDEDRNARENAGRKRFQHNESAEDRNQRANELKQAAGDNPQIIGQVFSNPAILSNTTFTVLVQNCRLQHEVQLDSGEDLVTRLVPIAEIPDLVRNAKIRHSLVVVALYHFDLWRRGAELQSK